MTGIRLFAALAIVAIHTTGSWFSNRSLLDATGVGYLGVPLFFMLSGYVLAWSGRSAGPRGAFYRARLARYMPLHLLTFVIALAFLSWPGSPALPAGGVVANVLLLQAWSPDPSVYYAANGVAWSLSCELFFYLLFPYLDRWISRLHTRGLRLMTVGVVVWMTVPVAVAHLGSKTWGQPTGVWFWLTFICPLYNLSFFVVGLLLVRLVDVRCRTSMLSVATVGMAGLTSMAVAMLYLKTTGTPARDFVELLVTPFLAMAIVAAAASDLRGTGRSVLRWRWVIVGGECSFAIYLTHQLVWKRLNLWHFHVPGMSLSRHELMPVYLAAAALVAVGAHFLIERPVERWLLRRRSRPIEPTGGIVVPAPTPDIAKAA